MAELHKSSRWGWGAKIPVLEWASKHGFGKDDWACERAAADYDLQALSWLKRHKFPFS